MKKLVVISVSKDGHLDVKDFVENGEDAMFALMGIELARVDIVNDMKKHFLFKGEQPG